MKLVELAKKYRPILEQAMQSVDDRTASEARLLLPELKNNGGLIRAGTRIRWGKAIYRAAGDLWDRSENHPDQAPGLWEKLMYREGIRVIPELITASAAFSRGEPGWWREEGAYESLTEGNVHTPEQAPRTWKKI